MSMKKFIVFLLVLQCVQASEHIPLPILLEKECKTTKSKTCYRSQTEQLDQTFLLLDKKLRKRKKQNLFNSGKISCYSKKCPRMFENKLSFAVHLLSTSGYSYFVCNPFDTKSYCGKSYASNTTLHCHKKVAHKETSSSGFYCNQCFKEAIATNVLVSQFNKKKLFKNISNLQNKNKFLKKFETNSELVTHALTFHYNGLDTEH